MDLYKYAAQNNLRFPSVRGELTVEQLFQLPLKSKTSFDLDSTAREINAALKSMGEESFVEDNSVNPVKNALTVALDIVKDVIATKQEENRLDLARAQRAVDRKKILDAIGKKKDEKMTQASLEDLEKQLAALDS